MTAEEHKKLQEIIRKAENITENIEAKKISLENLKEYESQPWILVSEQLNKICASSSEMGKVIYLAIKKHWEEEITKFEEEFKNL